MWLTTERSADSVQSSSKEHIQDWDKLLKLSIDTHLAPIVHESLHGSNDVPETVADSLSSARNQVLAMNMRLYAVFEWFLQEMNSKGIPIIPLKGIYAAEKLYGDIGLRHLSDIDVLVKREHVQSVVEIMQRHGWNIKEAKSHSDLIERELEVAHPYTFYQNGVVIELHTHLYDHKHGALIPTDELWEIAHEESFLSGTIYQFDTPMLLQHWCLHLHKHLLGHEVKMVSFWDIRLLLEKHQGFNWKRFKELCNKYSCEEEVFQVLGLCHKYWNTAIPDEFQMYSKQVDAHFIQFLGDASKRPSKQSELRLSLNLKRFNKLDNPWQKLVFLLRFIFPKQEFIRQCYQVPLDRSISIWYVYRPVELGVKLLMALYSKLLK